MSETIYIQVEGIEKVREMLDSKKGVYASRLALNKTLTDMARTARTEMRKKWALSPSHLKRIMKLRRARRDESSPSIRLRFTSSTMTIAHFKPKQTKKGVRVTIEKGKRILVPGAFIGKRGVPFRRVQKSGAVAEYKLSELTRTPSARVARKPLESIKILSAVRMFEIAAKKQVEKIVQENFSRYFFERYNRELKKK